MRYLRYARNDGEMRHARNVIFGADAASTTPLTDARTVTEPVEGVADRCPGCGDEIAAAGARLCGMLSSPCGGG